MPDTPMPGSLAAETARRRTFAIISHPDAGKTTLTEKLLLYSGAIRTAGSVKARKSDKHATSDWMDIEKQRGISVTSSAMQFEFDGYHINILDTPGHQRFFGGHLPRARRGGQRCNAHRRGLRASRHRPSSCSRSAACETSRFSPSSTRWTARAKTRLP